MPTCLLSPSPGFSVPVMLHTGRFTTTSFSATQRNNIVATSFRNLAATLLQHWTLCCAKKGDVTRGDSQRRVLAQHSVAMLEQCCNHSKQYRNNIMLQRCVALKRELKQQRRRRVRKRHLKGEVDAWNFIMLIPCRSIRKMLATISGVKCLNSVSKVRKGKRKPLSCVHVLHKTWN